MFEISIIIVSIIIILIFIIFLISNKKKHKHETYSNNNSNNEYTTNEITEQRLKYMNSGSIKTKRVMNIEETKIFYSMVKVLNNYNVNPQVSFEHF